MVTGSMFDFSLPSPNLIVSSTGHRVQILGPVGLRFSLDDTTIEIDSEMLAPPMSIGIYTASIPEDLPTSRADILDEVIQGLESAGFTVETIGNERR